MTVKYAISALLHSLYKLHHKLSEMDLRQRFRRYRRNTGAQQTPNITRSLNRCIDQLVAHSQSVAAESATQPSSAKAEQADDANDQHDSDHNISDDSESPPWIKSVAPGLTEAYKISASASPSDQCMGAKLTDSTWLHLHTSIMQARSGDVSKAKLHANIANDALKEAAHYMSEAEYRALCKEVEKALPGPDGIG